jgi:hypothetical protein
VKATKTPVQDVAVATSKRMAQLFKASNVIVVIYCGMIVPMTLNGSVIRETARLLRISPSTSLNVLSEYADQIPECFSKLKRIHSAELKSTSTVSMQTTITFEIRTNFKNLSTF